MNTNCFLTRISFQVVTHILATVLKLEVFVSDRTDILAYEAITLHMIVRFPGPLIPAEVCHVVSINEMNAE